MLELVEDTLKRMKRIEKRLETLKEEIAPAWQHLELGQFLQRCLGKLQKKIPTLEIIDQDSEIVAELLPEALFEPFKSSKDNGSGIDLWQVKRVVTSLGRTLSDDNPLEGGAWFVMRLSLAGSIG